MKITIRCIHKDRKSFITPSLHRNADFKMLLVFLFLYVAFITIKVKMYLLFSFTKSLITNIALITKATKTEMQGWLCECVSTGIVRDAGMGL